MNVPVGPSGATPLMRACRKGHLRVIPLLLRAGADPHTTATNGTTTLMAAVQQAPEASCDRSDIVRVLLSRLGRVARDPADSRPPTGSQVRAARRRRMEVLDALDADGHTALTLACRSGLWGAARLLMQAGCDVNLAGPGSDTPLIAAAGRSSGAATVARLLAAGADVDTRGANNQTALIRAARRGNVDVVRVLGRTHVGGASGSAADSHLEAVDARGASALVWAALRGALATVTELLACGAAVDGGADGEVTALMAAAHRRHLGVAKVLLAAGADVNVRTASGRRALSYAVSRGARSMVAHLLAAGASTWPAALRMTVASARLGDGHGDVGAMQRPATPTGGGTQPRGMLALAACSGRLRVVLVLLRHVPSLSELREAVAASSVPSRDDGTGERQHRARCAAIVLRALHATQRWHRRKALLLARMLRDGGRLTPKVVPAGSQHRKAR